MPAGAKTVVIAVGVGLIALLLVGIAFGAIGSAIIGKSPFLSQPQIHLPPQPVWPATTREKHLGLTETKDHASDADKKAGDTGHGAAPAKAESDHSPGKDGGDSAKEEHHSTPLGPMDFAITNTLLSAWFATIAMILFFVLGTRKRSLVPGRFQGVVEMLFEGILSFSSSVLGPEMARRTFPVVATIFFFVLFNAWLALLPFYQFLGYMLDGEIQVHLVRPAGTDLNMPLALALVSFVFVEYWGLKMNGFRYLTKFFAFGSIIRKGPAGLIDIFVGILELISEFVRIVSFTFRLFGNMTAGEILVVMITFLVPFVVTNLVYGLELLVGLIQSVIFAGLTLVFLSLAIRHEEH